MMNLAEITAQYRPIYKLNELPVISNSKQSSEILQGIWGDNICYFEEFKILLLNKANRLLGVAPISSGGVSSVMVDLKLVFQRALLANASSIILAHNHPSGNITPSTADIALTKRAKEAGFFMDIPILDHIIVTPDNFFSFADNGYL
jgi:DNA repair protein RadC